MLRTSRSRPSPLLAGASLGLASLTLAGGCLDRQIQPSEPSITTTVHEKLARSRIDKIDLVLMIDNSASMADKQAILSDAVPDLVQGLVAPLCVDDGGVAVKEQPKDPLGKCPEGSLREFEPVTDIHIGIISSSLGSYGTATCDTTANPSNDDGGRLVYRGDATRPQGGDNAVSTYQNKGFLAWDPAHELTPPGEDKLGEADGTSGLVPTLREMVRGVGQKGCGYEAQLESWYRFLVDPEPYASFTLSANGTPKTEGIDKLLLSQRADFLRPDSLVAVIMLTDENDCSFKDGGVFSGHDGADYNNPLPRARQECTTKGPNDPCCKSCGAPQGSCPPDPTCLAPNNTVANLSGEDNPSNLRCFDQKRRFGVDLLQPLGRYVDALRNERVPNGRGELVENPLYPSIASSHNVNARFPEAGLVFLAGIVGVPWQDIARHNAAGEPDLEGGLDTNQKPIGGFKSPSELALRDASGQSTWDRILGDPEHDVPPSDPLMRESRDPRKGLASPERSGPSANPINGHEWDTRAVQGGDLQYACTFGLPKPVDLSECTEKNGCECIPDAHNPLCQDDSGAYVKTQYRAKAYPGLRELGVLRSLGEQGILASVCPAQIDAKDKKSYGYRPAISAILERLKQKLSGQCLNRSLTPDAQGQVSCLVLEGRKVDPGQCACDAAHGIAARRPVQPAHAEAEKLARREPASAAAGYNCFCEIDQASGDELNACQTDPSRELETLGSTEANGWCYIDATEGHKTGNPALVENCAATQKRKIRFVGAAQQLPNSTQFITCSGH